MFLEKKQIAFRHFSLERDESLQFVLMKQAVFPKWDMTVIVGHMVHVIRTQFQKHVGNSRLFLPITSASTEVLLPACCVTLSHLLMMLSQGKWK